MKKYLLATLVLGGSLIAGNAMAEVIKLNCEITWVNGRKESKVITFDSRIGTVLIKDDELVTVNLPFIENVNRANGDYSLATLPDATTVATGHCAPFKRAF